MTPSPVAAAQVLRFRAPIRHVDVSKPWIQADLERLGPAAYTLAPPGVQRSYELILSHSDSRFVTRPVIYSQGFGASRTWAIAQQDDAMERLALYDFKGRFLGRAQSRLQQLADGSYAGSRPRTFIAA